jgi:hypothetical protein
MDAIMQSPSSSNTISSLTATLQKISADLEAESNVKEVMSAPRVPTTHSPRPTVDTPIPGHQRSFATSGNCLTNSHGVVKPSTLHSRRSTWVVPLVTVRVATPIPDSQLKHTAARYSVGPGEPGFGSDRIGKITVGGCCESYTRERVSSVSRLDWPLEVDDTSRIERLRVACFSPGARRLESGINIKPPLCSKL